MNILLHFFIIIIITIFYFNIYEQNKKISTIEVYENDYTNNNDLQKICKKDPIISYMNDVYINPIDPSLNINLFNNNDDSFIIIPYETLNASLQYNKTNKYYTKNNFLYGEPEFSKYIKPSSCFFSNLEIMGGSQNTKTNNYIHNYYRKFLYISEGQVTIHIKPHENETINADYINYIFNVNDISTKYIEFTIYQGQMLYIPPNTIYKITYNDSSILHNYSYHSISSFLSNIHHICLYYLQQTNTENNLMLKKI